MTTEPQSTVREDLAVALEMMTAAISPDLYRKAAAEFGRAEQADTAFKYTRAALLRHRTEPDGPCLDCQRKDAQIASLMGGHCDCCLEAQRAAS